MENLICWGVPEKQMEDHICWGYFRGVDGRSHLLGHFEKQMKDHICWGISEKPDEDHICWVFQRSR